MAELPLAHLAFEALAFAVGLALYHRQRGRQHDTVAASDRWSLLVAAILGALLGAKLLHHLAHPSHWAALLEAPWLLAAGKTIVGALLGGWAAVELAKRRLGIAQRTGDVYVLPLAAGIAIGRVGCFLDGRIDQTWGLATGLPWGVDFGDGVARHPTQLYEIAALAVLAALVLRPIAAPLPAGARFRAFLLGYLGWRLAVDLLKPREPLAFGLDAIQWACLLVLVLQAGELRTALQRFAWPRRSASPTAEPSAADRVARTSTRVGIGDEGMGIEGRPFPIPPSPLPTLRRPHRPVDAEEPA